MNLGQILHFLYTKLYQKNTVSATVLTMGGAQVQSLTPTPLKHFGPLKGGGGGWDQKSTPFFEPPWYPSNISQVVQIAVYSIGYRAGKSSAKRALGPTVSWRCEKFRPTPTVTPCWG